MIDELRQYKSFLLFLSLGVLFSIAVFITLIMLQHSDTQAALDREARSLVRFLEQTPLLRESDQSDIVKMDKLSKVASRVLSDKNDSNLSYCLFYSVDSSGFEKFGCSGDRFIDRYPTEKSQNYHIQEQSFSVGKRKWVLLSTPKLKVFNEVNFGIFVVFALCLAVTGIVCFWIFHNTRKNILLSRQRVRLDSALNTLKVHNEDLRSFSYAAAHDLQTPLRNMVALTHMIDEELDEDESDLDFVRRQNKSIQDEGNKLLRSTKDLLNILVVSRSDLNFSKFSIDELVDEEYRKIRATFPKREIQLAASISNEKLKGDRTMIGHIFQNLFMNAAKYSKENETIRIEVTVKKLVKERMWYLSVKDYGEGIPENMKKKVFLPFQRGHTDKDGTGIGLALVKKFIEKHKGQIWIESKVGHFTQVIMKIPFRIRNDIMEEDFT